MIQEETGLDRCVWEIRPKSEEFQPYMCGRLGPNQTDDAYMVERGFNHICSLPLGNGSLMDLIGLSKSFNLTLIYIFIHLFMYIYKFTH